jgi:hypothetical protein
MKRINAWLLAAALAIGLAQFIIPLRAQSQSQDPSTQQQPAEQAQTFTGKIAKKGEKYILRSSSDHMTYALDDQEKAKSFEGKDVKVTGTLDAQTNTIHVADIEPSA